MLELLFFLMRSDTAVCASEKHGHAIYAENVGARLHCVAW